MALFVPGQVKPASRDACHSRPVFAPNVHVGAAIGRPKRRLYKISKYLRSCRESVETGDSNELHHVVDERLKVLVLKGSGEASGQKRVVPVTSDLSQLLPGWTEEEREGERAPTSPSLPSLCAACGITYPPPPSPPPALPPPACWEEIRAAIALAITKPQRRPPPHQNNVFSSYCFFSAWRHPESRKQ